MRRLVNTLAESARAVERRTGITNAQLFILGCLAREGELTITALVERSLTKQSTVSVLVARLHRAGLVERRRSDVDRRRVDLRITARGRRVLARAPEPPMGRMIDAVAALRQPELDALIRGVGALLKFVGAPSEARPLLEPPARTRRA